MLAKSCTKRIREDLAWAFILSERARRELLGEETAGGHGSSHLSLLGFNCPYATYVGAGGPLSALLCVPAADVWMYVRMDACLPAGYVCCEAVLQRLTAT